MKNRMVIVIGGGVAGLSAAHELVERGFLVQVFERNDTPGGKARSCSVPGTGTAGRPPLPGEHGFRFFPRFYRHITDTMKRIPGGRGRRSVYDNLVEASREMIARFDLPPLVFPARFPRNLGDLVQLLESRLGDPSTGLTHADLAFFAQRVWQLMTSCEQRVAEQYDGISWMQFLDGRSRSEAFRRLLVEGTTRTLVAAKAAQATTTAGGVVFTQLLYSSVRPGRSNDALLNGPTNEVWIDPWVAYLRSRRVAIHTGARVEALHFRGGRITSVKVQMDGQHTIEGDEQTSYVLAVPVEEAARLLSPEIVAADDTLRSIGDLERDADWMTGIQFYLSRETPIVSGHVVYIDSPWALTSISQKQFWPEVALEEYGNGTVRDIVSVVISDWTTGGLLYPRPDGTGRKTALECTREEIVEEVWAQLKRSVNVEGREILRDADRVAAFLDPAVVFSAEPPHTPLENGERLLVNTVDSWAKRPDAWTEIPNLFLAGDYVRTHTNLATMEAANEAARRAVNCIVEQTRGDPAFSRVPFCKVWKLYAPLVLEPARWYDARRYAQGLPWRAELPVRWAVLQRGWISAARLVALASRPFVHLRRTRGSTGHPRGLR